MSSYNYDPYGYGYPPRLQPPSDVDPMGQIHNPSVYPPIPNPSYDPLRVQPWNSVASPPPPPPPDHHYHSSSLQYRPPFPTQPHSHYPPSYQSSHPNLSPSSSFPHYEPPPHQQQPMPMPSDPSLAPAGPDYYQSAQFQHQQYGSLQYGDHSGELRFPPTHSVEFQNTYGGGYGNSFNSVDNHADHLDNLQSSSSSAYPLESLLKDMRSSPPDAPRLQSQLLSSQSAHFHGHHSHYISEPLSGSASFHDYHRHSNSSSISTQSPYSVPTSSLSSHQYGGGGGSQNSHSTQDLVAFQTSNVSLKVLLLHGNLDITVTKARNLPNLDMFSRRLADIVDVVKAKFESKTTPITSDPYVAISVANDVIARTYVISNNENPVWNQHFNVPVAHQSAEVKFTVKDNDIIGSQIIGTVNIPAEKIYGGSRVEGTYSVLGCNGKECKRGATLSLSIQYIPVEKLSMYHRGVDYELENGGVPGTYFPLRIGGSVKLYQDAHVPWDSLPPVMMGDGMQYEHGQCWRDICEAIKNARRLIYITGWSVYHNVRLVRESNGGSNCTLGELLKSKSQHGVRVLLLVWDDPTSRSIMGYQKEGLMQTHDEETRRFFKHSSVHVLLCLRSGKRHSWVKQQETEFIFTHHQKTVVLDSDAGNGYRKITAFVGGLDLCDGRYDTPEHSIFRTLETIHKDDIHNPTFLTNIGGPREPWHDLHSRIDGPAAYDVLKNFEERWLKVSKPDVIDKLTKPYDDKLLNIRQMPDILKMDQCHYLYNNDPENWHVQIFRSIDSNSVKGFPKDPKEATNMNLVCGKNVLIDMSIHTAYVKAIRAAQHFIYIENQYFLGSSYNWSSHQDLGANNLIPIEIALKIACKIKSNERFSVYIVIPMWPEGNPTEMATQRILYWQSQTMQMMYEVIHNALVEVGRENEFDPQDYLNFFCLGNREALDGNSSAVHPTETNAPNVHSQKARRFMIYVHSKGMIVDDEYVIVGSANINQRSLDGLRDTEIAMGAYQPQHTWERKLRGPLGQIHAYRISLWAEHLGVLEENFCNPESIECMRRIRTLGEFNWKLYIADEVTEMRGHLMKYPVDVDRKGKVKPLKGSESFPDVGGHICGSFSAIQENLTI